MKATLLLAAAVIALPLGDFASAQEAPKAEPLPKAQDTSAQSSPEKPKLSQEELEANFKATLTKATFKGRWCSIQDGKLGPDKEDKYSILSINKVGGEVWLIRARIQYGKNDFVAPVPVKVKWAGDTPVIILDKTGVPGSGEYSARVMIYERTYAGTWSGGDHGGLLNGVITAEKE
jgi:hypothetical protein